MVEYILAMIGATLGLVMVFSDNLIIRFVGVLIVWILSPVVYVYFHQLKG